MATSVDPYAQHKETEGVTAHVLWVTTGLSCEGDSVAMTSATNPSLEDIITQAIPGMPKIVVHNQVIAYEVGDEFAQAWFDAEEGKLDPFVLVIEGSLGNENINGEGHWTGFAVNPSNGQPITINEWLDRLGAQGRGRGGRGDLRHLRRDPGDEEQPDRRDGRAGLPRLELEVERRPAGRVHPRLPGAARQHDGDAALPRPAPGRSRSRARAGREAASQVAVRAHRPRGLQPRRLRGGGRLRHGVRLRPPLPREARLQGARGQVQRPDPGLGERHRRLPERGRHLHGLHDARFPRQVHAVYGAQPLGRRRREHHAVQRTGRSFAASASATSRTSTTWSPSGVTTNQS